MVQACQRCGWSDYEVEGRDNCPVCGYDLSLPDPTDPEPPTGDEGAEHWPYLRRLFERFWPYLHKYLHGNVSDEGLAAGLKAVFEAEQIRSRPEATEEGEAEPTFAELEADSLRAMMYEFADVMWPGDREFEGNPDMQHIRENVLRLLRRTSTEPEEGEATTLDDFIQWLRSNGLVIVSESDLRRLRNAGGGDE